MGEYGEMTTTLAVVALVAVGVSWPLLAFLRGRKVVGDRWVPASEIIAREHRGRHRIERRRGIRMETCEKCGEPVLSVKLKGTDHRIVLDASPREDGSVIVLGGVCRFLDGPADYAAVRQHHLPVYRRHALHCKRFWPPLDHDPNRGTETR